MRIPSYSADCVGKKGFTGGVVYGVLCKTILKATQLVLQASLAIPV
jgi:hypothetical protein